MGFLANIDLYHEQAMKLTGLGDFGPEDYRQPMTLLLSDLDKYPRFNDLGVAAIGEQVTGYLIGRLTKQAGLKKSPAALEMPIERPIFITGMARTGTTVLHRLINQDPTTQSLPFWLGNLPMPRPPRDRWEAVPEYQNLKNALEQSVFFNEQTLALHPIAIDLPDECRWSTDQSFWCTTIAQTTCVPNYFSWLHQCDASFAYEYHRQVLGLVANGDNRRWVLKDPSHIFGIDSLLKVFPDACIVQTHRDPFGSMKSAANLLWEGRRKMIEVDVSLEEHGQLVLDGYAVGLEKMERYRRSHNPDQFYDVHMDETRADPMGTIERIYRYFNLPVAKEARQSWQQQVVSDPSVGHGTSTERHPDFGLTEGKVNDALTLYRVRYQQVVAEAKSRLDKS